MMMTMTMMIIMTTTTTMTVQIFILCAITGSQLRFRTVSADSSATSASHHQQQQQQPQQLQQLQQQQQQQQQQLHQMQHHSMSCYVCSTMDYENSADNLCRVMKQHSRSPIVGLQQPGGVGAGSHPGSIMSYPQSASSPPTTSTTTSSSAHLPQMEGDEADSNLSANDSQLVSANTSLALQSSTSSPANLYGHLAPAHHRAPAASNYIRTRPCLEDENFCSIVSVVRIEFVNDNLVSRFWAMERNCSRSCNTGCMLIGERVRLRVCSQCCRTANCNIGSGAKSGLAPHFSMGSFVLLLSLLLVAHSGSIRQNC